MTSVNYYLKGAISDKNIANLALTNDHKLKTYSDTPLQIVLKVSMAGSRLQVYTKKRIEPKFWVKNKQEVNCRKMKVGCIELNTWLTDLKKEVNLKCIQLETSNKRITKEDLLEILSKFSVNKKLEVTFSDLIEVFLSTHKTRSGKPIKKNTKDKYRILVRHLNNFCEYKRIPALVENINSKFIRDFEKYLRSELGHVDNTVFKSIKGCKTFFGYLVDKKIIEPVNFKEFKTSPTEGEIYTLTIEEILKIQEADFKTKKLNDTRDIFCFQCWTGQRISDILKIRWDDIHTNSKNEKVWNFISVKGEERVFVPIITHAERILSKYLGEPLPLPLMSSQKINENLKLIGLKVGLKRPVRKTRFFNGELTIEYIPFHKVLTTHVARKSFITNSLILDIPERIVRSISKHKSEQSFRRYVEISEEFKDQKIREAYNKVNYLQ